MVTGIICVICAAILLLKYVSRKLQWKKADRILGKIHRPAGYAMIFLIAIHMITTLQVWNTRNLMVVVSGIITGVLFLLMAAARLLRKTVEKSAVKLHKMGAILIILVLLLHIGSYYMDFFAYQKAIKGTALSGMDASEVPDGVYTGEYDVGYIYAKVSVAVKAGRIDNIAILEHNNERGSSAERVTDQIVDSQTTHVDTVSGATNSSKVIMKAVEKALEEGRKK